MQAFVQFTLNENTNFNHEKFLLLWVIAINNYSKLQNDVMSRQCDSQVGCDMEGTCPNMPKISMSLLFIVALRWCIFSNYI